MEIEKKFQIRELPENLEKYPKKQIEQGYLCSEPVVRIRRKDEQYILTYKSKFGIAERVDKGVTINNEVEVPLTKNGYEHLREKIDDYLIKKVRYIIPLQDGHIAELDVFEGRLKGLVFVEVEFKDEEDADRFVPPVWFGENVSDDKRYSNVFLSKCADLKVFSEGML